MIVNVIIRQYSKVFYICIILCLGGNHLKGEYFSHGHDVAVTCPNKTHASRMHSDGPGAKWCTFKVIEAYLGYRCMYFQEYEACVQKAWDECMDWALSATQNAFAGAAMGGITRVGGKVHRGIVIGGAVAAGGTYLGNVAFCLADSEYRKQKSLCVAQFRTSSNSLRLTKNNQISIIFENATDIDGNGHCDDCEDAHDDCVNNQR
jgi:hypothetical protein